MLLLAIVQVSCNKNERDSVIKQVNVKKHQPISQDVDDLIDNPNDAEDTKVNKILYGVAMAIRDDLKDNQALRSEVLYEVQTQEGNKVSLAELVTNHPSLRNSINDYYETYRHAPSSITGYSDYYDWAEGSLFHANISYDLFINVPNFEVANAEVGEFYVTGGLDVDSDHDTTLENYRAVSYFDGSSWDETMIGEAEGMSTIVPIYVVSPSIIIGQEPVLGYEVTFGEIEEGDSSQYSGLGKKAVTATEKYATWEYKVFSRFENTGKSEIANAALWIDPGQSPAYGLQGHYGKFAVWKNLGGVKHNWVGQGGRTTNNQAMVFNFYEHDWGKANQLVAKLPYNSTQFAYAWGKSKYYGETYLWDGASNSVPYPLNLHPYLWSTRWIYGTHGEARFWKVQ